MYKKVTIENFRGITHLEINDFKQVNLFVGENNCGKTSILEALFLITGPANAVLPLHINMFRDVNIIDENSWILLFNKLDVNANIRLSGELEKEKRELEIRPAKNLGVMLSQAIIESNYSVQPYTINGLILDYFLTKDKNQKAQKITTTITMTKDKNQVIPQITTGAYEEKWYCFNR